MKKLLCFGALLLGFNPFFTAQAQVSAQIDSLLKLLPASKPDTNRFQLLEALVLAYINEGNNQQGLLYARQSLQFAKSLENEHLRAKGLYLLASTYESLYKPDSSRWYIAQSIRLAQKMDDKSTLARNYNLLGLISQSQGLLDEALGYYQQGLSFARQSHQPTLIIQCLSNAGIVFKLKGEFGKATAHYLQALWIAEETNNMNAIGAISSNLGSIYRNQGDLAKAEEYYLRAREMAKQTNNRTVLGNIAINLGNVYGDRKKYAQALAYYADAQKIYEPIQNWDGIVSALFCAADIYREMNKLSLAQEMNLKALRIAQQTHNQEKMVLLKLNIGQAYKESGVYAKALLYTRQGLELSRKLGLKNETQNGYQVLSDIYAATGHYRSAWKAHQRYAQVKDSIFNEASTRKINELQLQYVTEKKNAQIKVLSQQAQIQSLQISHQRVLLFGSVALGLLLLLLLYVFFRQQKLKNDQKTTQLEQKTLLLQMNPHFIFNALTAIQMVVYQDNSAQAGKYISRFSKLMRLILENSRQEYISLQKEIQTLEYYFQLQQLRFAHTFDYQIYVDPQIDTTLVAIPPMFAQPLIENSMEHGLLHRHEQGQVHVRYLRQGDQILMEVEDNGVGRSQAAKQQRPETHTSLATQITQERLAILNRTQRRKVTLSIVDILGADQVIVGTKATFAIPYQTLL